MTRIVAIHGFLGNAHDWDDVKSVLHGLAPTVDFQTVDLFSRLPSTKEKTLHEWAKKFNRVQKNRHVERNILLGYSLGGRMALQAAYDKPGLWDEVVLISSNPGLLSPAEREARARGDQQWAQKFLSMPWSQVVKEWNDQPVFAGSREPQRRESDYSRESLASALVNWSLAGQDFAAEQIAQLKPKLHWFAGEKDGKYVDLFHNLKIDGFIEDTMVIKGSSHRVPFDNPEELARQLVQRLKL